MIKNSSVYILYLTVHNCQLKEAPTPVIQLFLIIELYIIWSSSINYWLKLLDYFMSNRLLLMFAQIPTFKNTFIPTPKDSFHILNFIIYIILLIYTYTQAKYNYIQIISLQSINVYIHNYILLKYNYIREIQLYTNNIITVYKCFYT